MIMIKVLAEGAASDATLMSSITELVNRVYAQAERGLWQPEATRTTTAEIAELTQAGELIVDEDGGAIVGVVHVRQLDSETGEFGMLAADPALRGRGIGRDLVRFAEDVIRDAGRRYMQLELLVPRVGVLESKVFLEGWYHRLGYRLQRVGRIEDVHPQLAPMLAVDTDFRIYRKALHG